MKKMIDNPANTVDLATKQPQQGIWKALYTFLWPGQI